MDDHTDLNQRIELFWNRMETAYGNIVPSSNHGNQTIEQFILELDSYYTNKLSTIKSQNQLDQWKPLVDTLTQIMDDIHSAELDQMFTYIPKTRDKI